MKQLAILNTSILTADGDFTLRTITTNEAINLVRHNEILSAVGHQSTADILTTILGIEIPVNRIMFEQVPGQSALVFKLLGRPEEGKILTAAEIEAIGYKFQLLEMDLQPTKKLVYCADCKYHIDYGDGTYHCTKHVYYNKCTPTDFCSAGVHVNHVEKFKQGAYYSTDTMCVFMKCVSRTDSTITIIFSSPHYPNFEKNTREIDLKIKEGVEKALVVCNDGFNYSFSADKLSNPMDLKEDKKYYQNMKKEMTK